MKKTFMTLLALSGMMSSALAALVTVDYDAAAVAWFTDLSTNGSQTLSEGTDAKTTISYTVSNGSGTFSSEDYLSVVFPGTKTNGETFAGQGVSNVALTLDLNAIRAAVADTSKTSVITLLSFDYGSSQHLALQMNASTGSVYTSYSADSGGSWTTWSDGGSTSYESLTSVLVVRVGSGDKVASNKSDYAFVKVYDQEGKGLLVKDGLGSNSNGKLEGITINTDYVTAVGIAPTASLNAEGVIAFATAAAAIPEPATATLSLLALAGLAARRRRK